MKNKMGATSITENDNKEQLADDVSEINVSGTKAADEGSLDLAKLEALKTKSKNKQQEEKMASKLVGKRETSIKFAVLGSGQGGSRLAESFARLGYPAACINTAAVDLKHITDIPDSNKLLLEYGLGGAAKNLDVGLAATEMHREAITELINNKLSDGQVNILCLSLGGGSGGGSAPILVDLLNETGKPLVVITALPMDAEDPQTKANSLITLSKLAELTKNQKINNLIVADNAKIETILGSVSQMEFYPKANKMIVQTLDVFNTLSATASSVKGIDGMEFGQLLIDGQGLSVYGEIEVSNFEEDTALAEAIVNNLDGNLLAQGFDLTASRYVGVIFAANKEVWSKIPSSSVSYAMSMVNDRCGSPKSVHKGIYEIDDPKPVVKVYSFFSGLLLPDARVQQLKKESAELQNKVKVKDDNRSLNLQLDTGVNETVSAAQKVKDKIAAKSSAFGKLLGNAVSDRRK